MTPLEAHLRDLIEALPQGASVELPRQALVRWLEEDGESAAERPERPVADLTVGDIAEAHDKAPSTVREWLQEVPGTYRLGNELRIPRRAWRAWLDSLADDGESGPARVRSKPTASLGDWRDSA